jgi:hypothetical protein
MVVPDSSPRASAVVSVRNPQRLALADETFFPPGCCVVPWGRASAPAGVAPEALEERECSCKVFAQRFVSVRGVSFSRHRQCFSRPRRCHTHISTFACVRCMPRRCSRASSPLSLGPLEAIGASSRTCLYTPSPSFRRTEG